jgi:hypothetical protein
MRLPGAAPNPVDGHKALLKHVVGPHSDIVEHGVEVADG